MKNLKIFSFRILPIILVIIGICFLLDEPFKSSLVNDYQVKVTPSDIYHGNHKNADYNFEKIGNTSTHSIVSARLHSRNVKTIGQMIVPSVGVHLPINLGISNPSLLLGAGTMKANQKMGKSNYALAGHHMINKTALFTPLWSKAKLGTTVYLTDMVYVYQYQIITRKIISPYDVQVIQPTRKPRLTLITCNDNGSKRLLLQGKLHRVTKFKDAKASLKQQFKQPTNNHQVLKGY